MAYANFQIILYSDIPFLNAFQENKEEKDSLFMFTNHFISLLNKIDKKKANLKIQLALPPIFYELLAQPEFQKDMTEFFERHDKLETIQYAIWNHYDCQMNSLIRKLIKENKLDLLAAPASYAPLPFLTTAAGTSLQIDTSLSIIEDYFEQRATGFWFPKGVYSPGLDRFLVQTGIQYSYINESAINFADPTPKEEGIPVKSPHSLTMFPLNEKLAEEIKCDVSEKRAWEWALQKYATHLSANEQTPIISVALKVECFINKMDEIYRSLTYLQDEGYIRSVYPCYYISNFEENITISHVCASFAEYYEHSLDEDKTILYPICNKIEKEIEQMIPFSKTKMEERIFRQMKKEWVLLLNAISDYSDINIAKEHIKAYEILKSYFTNGINIEWLNERENKFPVLGTTASSNSNSLTETVLNKVLMLSWEYPPHIVGGLSRHVKGIAESLIKIGYEVHIITTKIDDLLEYEIEKEHIHIHRVSPLHPQEKNFLTWVGGLNVSMLKKGMELAISHSFDVIHAHDWLVGASALALQEGLELPLVTTIHATEHGRNNGIYTEMQKFIHEKEQMLIDRSHSIIACSEFMKDEIKQLFGVNEEKLFIIPNGVNVDEVKPLNRDSLLGLPIDENKKLIFSIGRMVKEKGFDTMIKAAHLMKENHPDVYFIIAGKGPMIEEYRKMVRELNLSDRVYFVGFINDEQKNGLLSICDMAIFPSLYEPFGIVALESMVYGKPTIVSNTGGLKGIIEHATSGLHMIPGDEVSLMNQVSLLLMDPKLSNQIGENGKKVVESLFSWTRIGEETKRVLEEAKISYRI